MSEAAQARIQTPVYPSRLMRQKNLTLKNFIEYIRLNINKEKNDDGAFISSL